MGDDEDGPRSGSSSRRLRLRSRHRYKISRPHLRLYWLSQPFRFQPNYTSMSKGTSIQVWHWCLQHHHRLPNQGQTTNTLLYLHIRLSIELRRRRLPVCTQHHAHAKPRHRMNPRNKSESGQERSAMEKGNLREGKRRTSSPKSGRGSPRMGKPSCRTLRCGGCRLIWLHRPKDEFRTIFPPVWVMEYSPGERYIEWASSVSMKRIKLNLNHFFSLCTY